MEKLNYYPIIDTKREKSKDLISKLEKNTKINLVSDLSMADIILVWGWDWFMLDTIKNNIDNWKPFYGVNWGTLWFLLNNLEDEIPTSFNDIKFVSEKCLDVDVLTEDDKMYRQHAVWDVVVGGNVLDYCKFDISSPDFKQKVVWTWLIVSTVLGSSWYWLSNWWQILPLKSDILWIMWIATKPFNYYLLKSQKILITPTSRHDVMVWVDWYWWKIDKVKQICIDISDKIINLWFSAKRDFDAKRIALSNQKLWWL